MPQSPTPSPGIDTDHAKWDPQIIGLLGLICSIFLLFSYYMLLDRNCSNTFRVINLSRNSDQRRRINEHLQELSSQLPSRALDSCVICSLPISQIKRQKDEEEENGKNVAECAVCLGEFEDGEWVKHLPICSHIFHVSCIDTWFQTHSNCPLCRSTVDAHFYLEALDREDFDRQRSQQSQVTLF